MCSTNLVHYNHKFIILWHSKFSRILWHSKFSRILWHSKFSRLLWHSKFSRILGHSKFCTNILKTDLLAVENEIKNYEKTLEIFKKDISDYQDELLMFEDI